MKRVVQIVLCSVLSVQACHAMDSSVVLVEQSLYGLEEKLGELQRGLTELQSGLETLKTTVNEVIDAGRGSVAPNPVVTAPVVAAPAPVVGGVLVGPSEEQQREAFCAALKIRLDVFVKEHGVFGQLYDHKFSQGVIDGLKARPEWALSTVKNFEFVWNRTCTGFSKISQEDMKNLNACVRDAVADVREACAEGRKLQVVVDLIDRLKCREDPEIMGQKNFDSVAEMGKQLKKNKFKYFEDYNFGSSDIASIKWYFENYVCKDPSCGNSMRMDAQNANNDNLVNSGVECIYDKLNAMIALLQLGDHSKTPLYVLPGEAKELLLKILDQKYADAIDFLKMWKKLSVDKNFPFIRRSMDALKRERDGL